MLNSIESDLSETSKFDTLPKLKKRWLEDNFRIRKVTFQGLNFGEVSPTHPPFPHIRDPRTTWMQHMRQQATQHMMDPSALKKQGGLDGSQMK